MSLGHGQQLGRILPLEHRVVEPVGVNPLGQLPGGEILGLLTDRVIGLQHIHKADLTRHLHLAEGLHRQGMGDKDMVTSLQATSGILHRGRMRPGHITHADEDHGFIEGGPELDPIPEALIAEAGIFNEGLGGLPRLPTAQLILQRLGEIPVVEGDHGLDAKLQ